MPEPTAPASSRRGTAARGLAVAAVAAIAYAAAIPGGFVFDDETAILSNPVVNGQVPAAQAFTRDFWGNPPERTIGSYRPAALLSLAADGRLGGLDPMPFHAVNVVWHVLAVVAVFLVWRGIAGDRIALLASGLLAVLAAPAEAVQGIVGRADLMLGVFATAGLWAHRREGRAGAVLAAACLGLALGSKESAVAVPAAWWAMDLLCPVPGRVQRVPLARFGIYALVGAAWLAGRHVALGAVTARALDPISNPLVDAGMPERLLGACRVLLARYGAGLADPTRRLYDCSANACGPADAGDPVAWAGVAFVVLLASAPFLLRRRSPTAAAGLAWFGLLLLPSSNLLFLGPTIYGERLLYVPSAGLAVALAAGAVTLADRLGRPALATGAIALLGLANAAAVQVRNQDWRTPAALYLSGLEYAPDSAKVQYNVAWVAFRNGEYPAAEEHARQALALRPDHPDARALVAGVLDLQGRTAEAEAEFGRAFARGATPDLVTHHATFLARHGRYGEALAEVREQRARTPDHAGLRDLERRIAARIAPAAPP